MIRFDRTGLAGLLAMLWMAGAAWADPAVRRDIEFNRDIRPILADKCFACHGTDAKKRQAELRLDLPESAFREKEGVRPIVPGKPDKSALWQRICSTDAEEVMPPPESHKTLSDAERALLKRWIEGGAAYQKHWAFEAPMKAKPPRQGESVQNEIDSFLLDRLQQEKLALMPEADKPTLLRRLAFALTGLPPSPKEVDDFLADTSPDAYDKVVDGYLASKHYGEEMARHWLDVARYADTHGLHLDNERQMWAYRDWVVNAFNRNMPFDQFTVEQIAGDLLPNPSVETLVATGFNRCNVTTGEGGTIDAEMIYRYAVERTSTTMQTWMGMTGGCAACHDHKFDPLSQREFYSMYAFFHSAADPAQDGNSLLTAPTVKLTLAEQQTRSAAFAARSSQKQKEIDDTIQALRYADPALAKPAPIVQDEETIWVDDDFPSGAKVKYAGKWITESEGGRVFAGQRALQQKGSGVVQDSYETGAELTIPQAGILVASVWLDPQDMPKGIAIELNTAASGWEQRALWGDENAIARGKPNTVGRQRIDDLPGTGAWARVEVPLEKLGLQPGDTIKGISLLQMGGTMYWDKVLVRGRSDPASDPRRSFTAWREQRAGKETPGVPPALSAALKKGTSGGANAEQVDELLRFYLQVVCVDTKAKFTGLKTELDAINKSRDEYEKSLPSSFVFKDLAKPRESFVMIRGAYDKPGEKVEPSVPAVFPPIKKSDSKARLDRLDLARWLVSSEHPLTARVTVNRFWQQVFGVGLVKSSGDFGSQGEPPSHPELLDFLAVSFREEGWNVKHLMRRMVTSAAFRRASQVSPEMLARDRENRLWARGPRFRLDAEQLRDNALFVSGLINLEMGGKGVKTYQPPDIWEPVGFGGSNTRFYRQDSGAALYRRSLYVFLKRTAPTPFMSNFNAPNRETSCARRERSNTPLQALQLMNDIQHFEAARALAERVMREGGDDVDARIARAFKIVLGRQPIPEEATLVRAELATHRARYQQDLSAAEKAISHGESRRNTSLAPAELAAYTLVMNMMLNLDEAVTRN